MFAIMLDFVNPAATLSFEALANSRHLSHSYLDSLNSVLSFHDETINIWSHLLAAAFHGYATLSNFDWTRRYDAGSCAAFIFSTGATICFSCSALYHTFSNHSDAGLWQRMDHFGIATFIWASSACFSMLCFAERPSTRLTHTTVVTSFALFSLWQLQQDVSHWDEISWARFTIHAIYGSLASLPALHCASDIFHQSSQAKAELLRSFGTFLLLNGIGGMIYATKLIERITEVDPLPSGASHQVMHFSSIGATWIFRKGIQSFRTRGAVNGRNNFRGGTTPAEARITMERLNRFKRPARLVTW